MFELVGLADGIRIIGRVDPFGQVDVSRSIKTIDSILTHNTPLSRTSYVAGTTVRNNPGNRKPLL